MRRLALPLAAGLMLAANAPAETRGDLDVRVEGLRNSKGSLLLCLTQRRDFLDCDKDPQKVSRMAPAARAGSIRLTGLAPGRYSLLLVHDENGNGKLDTKVGIPREGFGFSNNPRIVMGPPRWKSVAFDVRPGRNPTDVKVRYLL